MLAGVGVPLMGKAGSAQFIPRCRLMTVMAGAHPLRPLNEICPYYLPHAMKSLFDICWKNQACEKSAKPANGPF